MSTSSQCRGWFAALFLSAWSVGFAQSFSFNPSNGPSVFDLTGQYTLTQNIRGGNGALVPLSIGVNLVQNPRGALSGSGLSFLTLSSNNTFAGIYTANGRIMSGAGGTGRRLLLNVHAHNTDVVAGLNSAFNVSVHYSLDFDGTGAFSGQANGSVKFGGLGSGRIFRDPVTLQPPTDGSWGVQMNVVPLSRLSGTGTITISNSINPTLSMRVNGRFAGGESIVRMTGIQGAQGNFLNLSFSGTVGDTNNPFGLDRLNGKVMGQAVRIGF